jgi:RNase H-fold protein (predicted Holliday junction resolvase)
MSDTKLSAKIPHFDGLHYDHWSELMENLLRAKGLWSMIEIGYQEPIETTVLTEEQLELLQNSKTNDHKVKHYLFRAIDRSVFEQILDRRTSKIVWDSLKRKYGGNDRVKKSMLNSLRREFEVLEMKEAETITEYFARVMIVANKMRSNGEVMSDSKVVQKILRTLTEKFTYVVVSIEESKDTEEMTVDELQSTLVVHEQKFKRVNRDGEQALKVESSRGRGRGTYRGRGRGRGRQSFTRDTVECFKCHNLGHFQYECPKWNKETNYAELDDEEELLLMALVEGNDAKRNDAWFLDSGCSNHMCGNKGMFLNMVEGHKHFVKCGNNSRMSVAGKGSVRLVFNGTTFLVQDVYYVPELRNNLLSLGQLQEKDLTILIKNGICKIYHPNKGLIAETSMSANRMFILFNKTSSITTPVEECLHTSSELTYLWHQRYGHLNHKGLKTL